VDSLHLYIVMPKGWRSNWISGIPVHERCYAKRVEIKLDLWNLGMFGHWDNLHELGGHNCNNSLSMVGRRIIDYVPVPILNSTIPSDILTIIIKHAWTVCISSNFEHAW